MARKSRRRYYRRKGKWSANIQYITNQPASLSGEFFIATNLASNPAQTNTTVSQQYTVKNFDFTYTIETQVATDGILIERVVAYIMYVPQGYTVNGNLPLNHPEWIMATRFLGSIDAEYDAGGTGALGAVTPRRNAIRIRSRMARRLQTGDSVIMIITGINTGSNSVNVVINGLLRWWTKAN